jgi:hypothetical protein
MKITDFSSVLIVCRLFFLNADGYLHDYMNIKPALPIAMQSRI